MVTVGLLATLQAKPGREKELAAFLEGALPLVQDEPETTAWSAIRIDERSGPTASSTSSPATAGGRPTSTGRSRRR
jgi:hypothetical protein